MRPVVTRRFAISLAFAILAMVAILYAQSPPRNVRLHVDTVPPTIDWIGQVGPNGEIHIKFSEPMDPATLNGTTIFMTATPK